MLSRFARHLLLTLGQVNKQWKRYGAARFLLGSCSDLSWKDVKYGFNSWIPLPSYARNPKVTPFLRLVVLLAILFRLYAMVFSSSQWLSSVAKRRTLVPDIFSIGSLSPFSRLARWKSDSFARSHLRVFVYKLPASFNLDLIAASLRQPPQLRDPWCDSNFYSADHVLATYLKSRRALQTTTNPVDADIFYVPVYTTCFLLTHLPNNTTRTGEFFKAALDHIITNWPFWNRSHGHDHVFAFTQGLGARMAGNWRKITNATFLVHNGDVSESHFRPAHDIVIPPNLVRYLVPAGQPLHTRPPVDAHRPRTHFAFFGGQILPERYATASGSNHSRGVRQRLYRDFRGLPGYHISANVRAVNYVLKMAQSTFCLAPEGWHKWSPRPYYAVLLDCIPVVISSQQELALGTLIDYSKFVVFVDPERLDALDDVLREISDKDIARRREEMRRVWRLLHYGHGGLAREAILEELSQRVGRMLLGKPG